VGEITAVSFIKQNNVVEESIQIVVVAFLIIILMVLSWIGHVFAVRAHLYSWVKLFSMAQKF
jgi:hypothetical protein